MGFNVSANSSEVAIVGSVTTTPPGLGSTQTIKMPCSGIGGQSIGSGSDVLLYDTTAAKTFYVNSITFYNQSAVTADFTLKDGSGGTAVFNSLLLSSAVASGLNRLTLTFATPLKFTSDVYIRQNSGSAITLNWSLSGWEE